MRRFQCAALVLMLAAAPGPAVAEDAGAPEDPSAAGLSAPEAAAAAPAGVEEEGGEEDPVETEAAAPATIDEALAALQDREEARRIAAARVLGESGDLEVVPRLIEVLQTEPNPEVRAWMVRALASLWTRDGQEAIVQVARADPDERVRSLAARLAGLGVAPPVGAPPAPPAEPAVRPDYGDRPSGEETPRGVPGRGLAITGWSVFGGAYLSCFLAGVIIMAGGGLEVWPLLLPAVGPGILGGMLLAEPWGGGEVGAALSFVAMGVQVAALALLGVGHARMARFAREQRSAARSVPLALVPSAPGGAPGLAIVGAL